jgi:hypothetical protein
MPAFAYTGMQYARIARYYFAQIQKSCRDCVVPPTFEILFQQEKPRKTGLSRGDIDG